MYFLTFLFFIFHLGGKSDFEKNKDALEIISKMLEILDRFEKKCKTEPEKDNIQSLGNTTYSQQKTWLNQLKTVLT